MLTFTGGSDIRYRLVMSTLTGKSIKITNIRPDALNPGLTDNEVSFLRLLESITNGSVIEISYTGTAVVYKPGIIVGGSFTHQCPTGKAVGYYIEPMLLLAPFAKNKTSIVFKGITTNNEDIGVDAVRTVLFPSIEKFGIKNSELRIVKRGSLPRGGGECVLSMSELMLQPETLHATKQASVAKIRGIAYSTRVSPASVNRMIDVARETLKPTEVETFVYSDVMRGEDSGLSPGFGITLVAETRSGWPVATQIVAEGGSVPEELGARAAQQLLYELSLKGAMGRMELPIVLILMALGREDLGRVLVGQGQIEGNIVELLRDIKSFFGVEAIFKEQQGAHEGTQLVALKGSGFISASRKIA